MGYRSDVAIAIYGPEDAMVPFLAAQRMKEKSILITDRDYVREFADENAGFRGIASEFDHVKWYESFPDVQAWLNLLTEAAETEGINTEFVRVGEEPTDIEAAYHGDECVYYLTTFTRIESDIPETPKSSEDNHDNSNASTAS
jgi:hypothetical protein